MQKTASVSQPIGGTNAHTKLQAWLLASRPKTLFTGWAPVLLGCGLSAILLKWQVDLRAISMMIACSLVVSLLQVGANIVNDVKDFKKSVDTADRKGPLRVAQAGLLTASELEWGYRWMFGLALVIGSVVAFVAGWQIFVLGMTCMVFAYWYSGSRYALSHLALGELVALIFFGPVAVLGTIFVVAQEYRPDLAMVSVIPGLFSAAMMAVNNARDINEDQKAGKTTLATLLGSRFALLLPAMFMAMALVLGSIFMIEEGLAYQGIAFLLCGFICYRLWVLPYLAGRAAALNECLKRISIFNLVLCIGFVALLAGGYV